VDPTFNPRQILQMVMLDMREEVLSSPVPWLCSACDLCFPRCPQQVHISELMQAIRNIAIREGYEPPGPTAIIAEELCSGCGFCVAACPYGAIELVAEAAPEDGHGVAQVDKYVCMGCGICSAACPSEAIQVEESSRARVAAEVGAGVGNLAGAGEPKIVVFLCNWCVHAENDLAGLKRLPSRAHVVHVPCTGHLDPSLILGALRHGADGVLVVGCLPGECHYQRGNLLARRRIAGLIPLLDALGIGGARLSLEWVSAADRGKVLATIEQFAKAISQLGPNRLGRRYLSTRQLIDTDQTITVV
jgi:heterodisulfide reductase subunit A